MNYSSFDDHDMHHRVVRFVVGVMLIGITLMLLFGAVGHGFYILLGPSDYMVAQFGDVRAARTVSIVAVPTLVIMAEVIRAYVIKLAD